MLTKFSIRWIASALVRALIIVILTALIGGSVITIQNQQAQTRVYTRPVEFNFLDWTIAAVFSKVGQWSLGSTNYLQAPARHQAVDLYLEQLSEMQRLQGRIEELYGDPDRQNLEKAIATTGSELDEMRTRVRRLRPFVETIMQEDIGAALQELGFSIGGSPFPPVLMQFSPLPTALIVSPRDQIRQDANVTLQVGLTLEEKIALERRVESELDVSALVVPIGGLGTYPTMIQQSTTLAWITEVIGHEWTHNYLTLHPLGINYSQTPELRTMNETAASLMGVELSRMVLSASYPEYLPPEESSAPVGPQVPTADEEQFDFRAEMRATRVRVEELLEAGQIETAEEYMEKRRIFFWDHGYQIRKLNQAYFAFHGAYADEPGGAAGDDPVGAAVRALWETLRSPTDFLRLMASLSSYDELEQALQERLTTR